MDEKVVKQKYKVKHGAVMAFRGAGDKRKFDRHEVGEHVELTEEEFKAHPEGQLEEVPETHED